jgi:uncharacterized protein YdhG (YjbR/CyaY superfamily)
MGRSKEVDAWFGNYENPMKGVVQRIRTIVLAADPRIEECIKWQAPTFTYRGNLASFYPKSKQHASLMFHLGAKIPGDHPQLEGSGGTSRVLRIGSVAEANAAKGAIQRVVKAWCAWRDNMDVPAQKPRPARRATRGGTAVAKAKSKLATAARRAGATKGTRATKG